MLPSLLRLSLLWLAPFALLLALPLPARALVGEARVNICYNYGCQRQAEVDLEGAALRAVERRLRDAEDGAAERAALARSIGRLYLLAGRQTPVASDRAGNYLDQGIEGRMDCIDHSTSTTRLLQLLEARGWLRFHRVLEPVRRTRFIFQHFSASIEELPVADGQPARYVVDSWFVDNGEPAVVMPLVEWLNGGGPNVQ